MKKILVATLILYSVCTEAIGQKPGDMIIGKWLKLPKQDLIIDVYKINNRYNGKINWSASAGKPAGFIIIEGLKYNPRSNSWENGKIRDPNSSRIYTAEVKLGHHGNLVVRGYKGVKFIGSSRTFKRVN